MPRRFIPSTCSRTHRSPAIRLRSCSTPRGSTRSACRPSPTSSTSRRPSSSAPGRRGASGGFADLHAEVRTALRGPSDRGDGRAARAPRPRGRAGSRLCSGSRKRSGSSPVPSRSWGRARGRARFRLPRLPEIWGERARAGARRLRPRARASGDRFDRHRPSRHSGGVPYDLVPVASLDALARAQGLGRNLRRGIRRFHPSVRLCLCPQTDSGFRARMFFPGTGLAEDPATGSAAAAFAGALMQFEPLGDGEHDVPIRQGVEMGRPSEIALQVVIEKGALAAGRDRRRRRRGEPRRADAVSGRISISRVARLEARCAPKRWAWAEENRDAIEANWARVTAGRPRIVQRPGAADAGLQHRRQRCAAPPISRPTSRTSSPGAIFAIPTPDRQRLRDGRAAGLRRRLRLRRHGSPHGEFRAGSIFRPARPILPISGPTAPSISRRASSGSWRRRRRFRPSVRGRR